MNGFTNVVAISSEQMLLLLGPGSTFRKYTFCDSFRSRNKYLFFALISPNWFIFIAETKCFWCSLRTESIK